MTHSLCYTHEALTSLAPHERLPELPVIPREKPHTGAAARENPPSSRDWGLLFLPDLESNPWSFLQTSQEALLPLGHSMGSKRYLSRLERRAEYFVSPRDEALPRVSLECNPEIPVAPGEEHYVLDKSLDEVYFALQ